MFRIKRQKGGAVHYAAAIARAGNVFAWTRDKEQARAVTNEDAARVKAFYDKLDDLQRKNAGSVSSEPVSEEEIKAALDKKQEVENSLLVRLVDDRLAPVLARLAALEAKPNGQAQATVGAVSPKEPEKKPAAK